MVCITNKPGVRGVIKAFLVCGEMSCTDAQIDGNYGASSVGDNILYIRNKL